MCWCHQIAGCDWQMQLLCHYNWNVLISQWPHIQKPSWGSWYCVQDALLVMNNFRGKVHLKMFLCCPKAPTKGQKAINCALTSTTTGSEKQIGKSCWHLSAGCSSSGDEQLWRRGASEAGNCPVPEPLPSHQCAKYQPEAMQGEFQFLAVAFESCLVLEGVIDSSGHSV